jgi:hypothetical protein
LRERLQDFERAREGNYAIDVFDFAALDFAIFGVVIGVRQEFADGGEARATVGLADDIIGDEAVFVGPDGPDTGDCGGGVDEHAIEIEEHSAALNFHGRYDTYFAWQESGFIDLVHRLSLVFRDDRSEYA